MAKVSQKLRNGIETLQYCYDRFEGVYGETSCPEDMQDRVADAFEEMARIAKRSRNALEAKDYAKDVEAVRRVASPPALGELLKLGFYF